MITADLHTHTSFSTDSGESLLNAAASAEKKGLKTLCVTEHMDFDYPGGEFVLDTRAYKEELMRVRELFEGRVEILFGVELGLADYLAPRLSEYLSGWDFDFVIGSAHLVDGEDPYYPEYFDGYGDKNGLLRYFECELADLCAFKEFDVFGHLDYAVRYSKSKTYAPKDFVEVTDEILRELVKGGRGIELNTAGLKNGLGFAHPHADILKRYRELGGRIITVGSDAHRAEDIAYSFEDAREILINAGFEYYAVFRKRKPELLRL